MYLIFMKNNKTILYYSSNRENPEFEQKIRDEILKICGNIPIVSVSQKPINFGKNICVGNVGHSYLNLYRQTLIGAKAAKTEYLIFAEADFLYSKEYFDFEPKGANLYRYDNDWVILTNPRFGYKYFKKPFAGGTLICKRQFMIDILEEYLEGQPEWIDGNFVVKDKNGKPKIDHTTITKFEEPFEIFTGSPCVSFKTGDGMTQRFSVPDRHNKVDTLPYWGNGKELCKKMCV